METKTNIEQSVLKTLAYYRALKTPLTLVQLGRYLISDRGISCSLGEIAAVMNGLVEKNIVTEQKGLYWLKMNASYSEKAWLKFVRLEKISQRKISKVLKALRLFSLVPYLRALFICGSVGRRVSRPKSDIDFLILTKADRVWTVRLFLTFFAFLLGKKTNDAGRITDKKSRRNKFCLNHYRSSARLGLEDPLRDLYSAEEYAGMINVYASNRTDRKFFKKNKLWMKKIIPNFNFSKLPATLSNEYFLSGARRTFEKMLEGKIGHIIERLLYLVQLRKINRGSQGLLPNQRVIAEKEVIMFHLNPRAPLALKKYEQITGNQ